LRDQIIDLIHSRAVCPSPIPPLRAIHASELAFFIGLFIPNRYPMLIKITNVRITAQEPQQLVEDGFDVQLFRREQRKPWSVRAQIKSGWSSEHRQRSLTRAILAWPAVIEHQPKQIVILSHAKILSR